jgi:hypothetical protein
VCLAVWLSLSAEQVSGKILAIFFPIMAFVAMGFDHVVANMFFLPAAIFAGVPELGWDDTLNNWLFAFLGNLVGAVVFVSTSYWYLYPQGRAVRRRRGRPPGRSVVDAGGQPRPLSRARSLATASVGRRCAGAGRAAAAARSRRPPVPVHRCGCRAPTATPSAAALSGNHT